MIDKEKEPGDCIKPAPAWDQEDQVLEGKIAIIREENKKSTEPERTLKPSDLNVLIALMGDFDYYDLYNSIAKVKGRLEALGYQTETLYEDLLGYIPNLDNRTAFELGKIAAESAREFKERGPSPEIKEALEETIGYMKVQERIKDMEIRPWDDLEKKTLTYGRRYGKSLLLINWIKSLRQKGKEIKDQAIKLCYPGMNDERIKEIIARTEEFETVLKEADRRVKGYFKDPEIKKQEEIFKALTEEVDSIFQPGKIWEALGDEPLDFKLLKKLDAIERKFEAALIEHDKKMEAEFRALDALEDTGFNSDGLRQALEALTDLELAEQLEALDRDRDLNEQEEEEEEEEEEDVRDLGNDPEFIAKLIKHHGEKSTRELIRKVPKSIRINFDEEPEFRKRISEKYGPGILDRYLETESFLDDILKGGGLENLKLYKQKREKEYPGLYQEIAGLFSKKERERTQAEKERIDNLILEAKKLIK